PLVVAGQKVVTRLLPSGVLHPTTRCLLGAGMVVDPVTLLQEIDALATRGITVEGRLGVSPHAHAILSYHRIVDELRERGPGALGTTKRGIGPAYEDKAARRGLRLRDLCDDRTRRDMVARALEAWRPEVT